MDSLPFLMNRPAENPNLRQLRPDEQVERGDSYPCLCHRGLRATMEMVAVPLHKIGQPCGSQEIYRTKTS